MTTIPKSVAPDADAPTDHFSISDGTDTLYMNAVGIQRRKLLDGSIIEELVPDFGQVSFNPIDPMPIKTMQGTGEYDDMNWPWKRLVQNDWSGGRGLEDFDEDHTRFYDSHRLLTDKAGQVILGPLEYLSKGIINQITNIQTDWDDSTHQGQSHYQQLISINRYHATQFTVSAADTYTRIRVRLRYVGSPGTLTLAVYTDNGSGSPGTLIASQYGTITTSATGIERYIPFWYEFTVSGTGWTSAANYWLVAYGAATDDATNYWEIGSGPYDEVTTKYSPDGSGWSTGVRYAIGYQILENGYDPKTKYNFFKYKGALYNYSQPITGNSKLYLNGDRGVADDNAGHLDRLVDDSKSGWVADEFNNGIVIVVKGPGSEETQPWRSITDTVNGGAGSRYLTVSPSWNVTHTTATEYVIIKDEKWTEVEDLGGFVTDHAVTDEYVYFARGETASLNVRRYRWYSDATGEHDGYDDEIVNAEKLLALKDVESGSTFLYGSRNQFPGNPSNIWRAEVPKTWNDLWVKMGKIAETGMPWDEKTVSNVSHDNTNQTTLISATADFTTGTLALKNLAEPVDITKGDVIGFWMLSTHAMDANDLRLVLDDQQNMDGFDGNLRTPVMVARFKHASDDKTTKYSALQELTDGDTDSDITFNTAFAWKKKDKIVVIDDKKFNTITINIGTVNTTDCDMSAKYFNGSALTTLSITDNTKSGAKSLGVTGAQTVVFTAPSDWKPYTIRVGEALYTGYIIWLKWSADLDNTTTVSEINTSLDHAVEYNLPALVANTWTFVMLAYTPSVGTIPDDSQIRCVGLRQTVDHDAAYSICLKDDIWFGNTYPFQIDLPGDSQVNALGACKAVPEVPQESPIVWTETEIYNIQGDLAVPMSPGEMEKFSSERNGLANCVNGPYLIFNVGEEKIERYYNGTMEDIGPDLDNGLPEARRGRVTALLSYPGRIYVAMSKENKTASILRLVGKTYHEEYRAWLSNNEINSLYFQPIPGSETGRLWFDEGGILKWIPVTQGDPYEAANFHFTDYGSLETGWFYANLRDVIKIWDSLTVFGQYQTSTNDIYVDFKTDADTSWTAIAYAFDLDPSEEKDFATTRPSKKRMRLRIRFHTTSTLAITTPRLKAIALAICAIIPSKYQISFPTVLADGYIRADLLGQKDKAWGYNVSATTAFEKYKTFCDGGSMVTVRSCNPIMDNRTMFCKYAPLKTSEFTEGRDTIQKSEYLAMITLTDV